MIGSTLSRMAAAEKLSIPQLQRAIQDGTLPAYVGIPILQDKVRQEQQAKMVAAGAQQGGQRPTVADQVMQEANVAEAGGVDQLPVQAPAMAGGGIVAFASGGDADSMSAEDYADYMQEAEDDEDDARQAGLLKKLSLMSSPDMSYKDVSQGKLAAAEKIGAYKGITGDHKYSDLIRSEAKKVGLDPEYALKIAMIETGGLKNPESARSKAGAIGIMQLMPATAKGLGVDPTVPEENVRGGVSMLKRLVDKYGDYQLAGAAYNAGEGRVDRALRSQQGLAGLPGETQGYMSKIRGMKEGGIAHFDVGGKTTIDPVTGEVYTEEGTTGATADIIDFFKRSAQQARGVPDGSSGIGLPAAVQQGVSPRALENKSMTQFKAVEPTLPKTAVKKDVAPAEPVVDKKPVVQETKPAEPSVYDRYIEQLMNREGDRANQAEQDKWMSLLTAGLGMMAGTSPYAAANIGQGAMAGVSNYAALRKQAAAQEAADVKNMLLAQKYKESGDIARQTQAYNEAIRREELGLRASSAASAELARKQSAFRDYDKEQMGLIEKQFGTLMTPQAKAAVEAFRSSPEYITARNSAFPDLPALSANAGTTLPQGVIVRPR